MRVLASIAPEYMEAASIEVRRSMDVTSIRPLGEDAVVIDSDLSVCEIAERCTQAQLRFIRHLAQVDATLTSSELRQAPEVLAQWVLESVDARLGESTQIGLHVWDSGPSPWPPSALRHPLLAALQERGVRVRTSGASTTLSVCLGRGGIVCGVTPARCALIDWAGGRIRLARRPTQISRAEFKLEELLALRELPIGGIAVDLGASPGGWTRVLLEHGASRVLAVDPGALDDRLSSNPAVEHHRTTAGTFLSGYRSGPVDLVVNDMKMDPALSARVMVDAARILRPGGHIVMTLKLGVRHAVDQVDDALARLAQAYEPVFVRQLQHNRHEMTVAARRRDEA